MTWCTQRAIELRKEQVLVSIAGLLRRLPATPLRFERHHGVFPSRPAPPGLASAIRAGQRSSNMASGSCFACCTQRASELRKEQVFVSMAGCAACWRRRYDLIRTTTFSHHDRHLQALPAVFARASEAQRWLQDHVSPAVHSERASCEKSRFLYAGPNTNPAGGSAKLARTEPPARIKFGPVYTFENVAGAAQEWALRAELRAAS